MTPPGATARWHPEEAAAGFGDARLHRACRQPRNLRAPGGNGRGHVPARALRAHRRRHTHGIGEGIRSPMSSETDQTSDLAAQGGQTSVLRRRSWRKLAMTSLIVCWPSPALPTVSISKPSPTPGRCRSKRQRHYPSRSSTATIACSAPSRQRRAVAAAAPPEGCRSALPQNAVRLRRQALLQPPRYRSESVRSCRPADGAPRAHRLRRLDADDAGRSIARRQARAHAGRQATPDGPRHRARARVIKTEILKLYLRLAPFGGNLEGVRAAIAGLFRQGTAPAFARGIGAARGFAAVTRSAPPRSQSGSGTPRPQSRSEPRRPGAMSSPRRTPRRPRRSAFRRTVCVPDAGAASRRIPGR